MFLSHPVSTPQEIEPLLSHNRSDTTKHLYLVFYASWCPDCVNADPTIQATFGEKAPSEGRDAVSVMVGSREVWKAPNNAFRQSPYSITNIPTILRKEGGKEAARIVEADIMDEGKLSAFLRE